jgi:hypothetical protein
MILVFGVVGSACSTGDDANTVDGVEVGTESVNRVLQKVAITTLPGASPNAGAAGVFVGRRIRFGNGTAPALSNSVVSAFPGAPAKPLFVGQAAAFDTVIVAVRGQSGHFEVPAANNKIVGLDLVPPASSHNRVVTVLVATKSGGVISAPTPLRLFINNRVFLAAGDLQNHDMAEGGSSDIADLFASFLEGTQGFPPVPTHVLNSHDNNLDVVNGVKGPSGPVPTGHREILWDGVPETLRNQTNFNAQFFNRSDTGTSGVRGGIVFQPNGGTGEEVNDTLAGVIPNPATVGPPTNPQAPLGGDFSNINPKFAGNLLSFTQSAQFAPLGTVVTDITFNVAGSNTPGVVKGLGIVFSSVDREGATTVEYFDEQGNRVAKLFAPVQSQGPFPFPGPVSPDKFPYSFVGFLDPTLRIAHVRVTTGEVPLDQASDDLPNGPGDVVAFDDVYYAEPNP